MTLTMVGLFAGIGGFDLAAERAGIQLTAAVEIDKQADSSRYRQIGNAVAVPVVEWIMARIVAHD